jgi:predicted nucleic acid-binding protein
MVYLIDASVASRFLLIEDLSDEANLVLDNFLEGKLDLRAPKLVIYEVGNTLWKAVKQNFISLEEATQKFSYFLELKINSIELDRKEHEDVLEWSVKNNATYYDSAYVMSSKKIGATLLTADDTLYEKAREENPTIHLKDYQR